MSKYSLYILTLLILLSSCDRPKNIPDETLKDIFKESMITSALLENRPHSGHDTVDYYKKIAEKYGYTIQDVEYTVEQMSMRKSNPMNNILEAVVVDMEHIKAEAEARYRRLQRFDSAAMVYSTDTLYFKDSTIRGSLSKYTIKVPELKRGLYLLKFDYRSAGDYTNWSKSARYKLSDTKKKIDNLQSSAWLARNTFDSPFELEIPNHKGEYDSLYIYFEEIKKPEKDTSYIKNITVSYTPSISTARKNFMTKITGIPTNLEEFYEKRYFTPTDSLPIHFITRGR